MTLDEIAIKHGTDKATVHPTGAHGYTPHYERAFSPIRQQSLKILEIGVGGGESIKTWLEYFPNSRVYGVDIVQDTNHYNTKDEFISRYSFVHGDQSDAAFWKLFEMEHGDRWDIIIDDGGHCNDQIITTFCSLWYLLSPGGLYCIEDLGVAYGVGSVFIKPAFPSHMEFLKNKMDEINKDTHNIDWMMLSKELAIIRKKPGLI